MARVMERERARAKTLSLRFRGKKRFFQEQQPKMFSMLASFAGQHVDPSCDCFVCRSPLLLTTASSPDLRLLCIGGM